MEQKQDSEFFVELPLINLKNCFVKNEEKDFYNVVYTGENLSFLLILSHDILDKQYSTINMEELYKINKHFKLFGFVITNSSLNVSLNRFKEMLENNYASDIIDTLQKWSVFKIDYSAKGVEVEHPISQLKNQIMNIINKNKKSYI